MIFKLSIAAFTYYTINTYTLHNHYLHATLSLLTHYTITTYILHYHYLHTTLSPVMKTQLSIQDRVSHFWYHFNLFETRQTSEHVTAQHNRHQNLLQHNKTDIRTCYNAARQTSQLVTAQQGRHQKMVQHIRCIISKSKHSHSVIHTTFTHSKHSDNV